MGHTPGPWEAMKLGLETDIRVSSDGPLIAQCNWSNEHIDANASLIAAAPELLEALTSTTLWIEEYVLPAAGNPQAVQRFLDRNRAAIAKATNGA